MLLKFIITSILISGFSAFAQASEFIEYYRPTGATQAVVDNQNGSADVPVVQPAVVPVAQPDASGSNAFSDYLPDSSGGSGASVQSEDPSAGSDDSSEVKGSTPPDYVAPMPLPRPKPAPPVIPAPRPVPGPTNPDTTKISLYDLTDCSYNHYCWSNRRAEDIKAHMKKIISNVNYINKIHGTTFDPRYMLCTGWRESKYNPGALGGAGERGMFQVMVDTAAASLRASPPVLEEFKNYRYKPDVYLRKMVNSSLAQTELSFSVLQEKAKVLGGAGVNVNTIFHGHASVAVYRKLAVRYNGSGPRARAYGNAISNCLACMRRSDGLPDLSKDFNYSSVDGCLDMATK